jgi:hypothetical protein
MPASERTITGRFCLRAEARGAPSASTACAEGRDVRVLVLAVSRRAEVLGRARDDRLAAAAARAGAPWSSARSSGESVAAHSAQITASPEAIASLRAPGGTSFAQRSQ